MLQLPDSLIISRTDNLGDVILTLPLAGYLKSIKPSIKIFFIGKAYTKPVIEELLKQKDRIHFSTFEDIFIRDEITFEESLNECIEFIKDNYTGLEIDIDAIQNIPSSAKTSSGISTIEARKYIHRVASTCNVAYFHIAEAAPLLSHIKTDLKTGKLVTYLIGDYIKSRNKYHLSANE